MLHSGYWGADSGYTEDDVVYWGDGGDGSGRNRLGLLLMELRNALTDPLLMCSYLMRAFSLLGLKFELDQT